jgi:hypothetical protein
MLIPGSYRCWSSAAHQSNAVSCTARTGYITMIGHHSCLARLVTHVSAAHRITLCAYDRCHHFVGHIPLPLA